MMLSQTLKSISLVMAALILLPSAAFSARIQSVTTCESVSGEGWIPVNIRDTFTSQVPEINVVIDIDDARKGMRIKCVWISVDAISTPNYEIAAAESECYRNGEAKAHFTLTQPDKGWPPGNYKVAIYIDDQQAAIKTFSISASSTGTQARKQAPAPQPQRQTPRQQPTSAYGYSGTYQYKAQGVALTLELNHQPSGKLTGSLSSSTGVRYQLDGMVESNIGYGACSDGQGTVFFESEMADDQVYFLLIEPDANNMPDYSKVRELLFVKQSTPQPPANTARTPAAAGGQPHRTQSPSTAFNSKSAFSGGGGKRQQAAAPLPSATGRPGQTFRHPVGFSFWYPQNWTTTMHEGFVQLTPPNPGKVADGPTELYFLIGDNVAPEGITKPDDPRVVQFLDQQIKTLAGVLQYTGQSTPVNMTQGKGALLKWSGTGANGVEIVAHAFVCIINNYGVALTGVGHKKDIDARDQDLRQMFASFGFGQGKNDPALIGTWDLMKTVSITNQSVWETDWSRAQAVSETSSRLSFQPDGTWTRNDQSHTLVGSSGIWLEDKSNENSQGIWNAGDGILYMLWQDNSYRECGYRLETSGGRYQLRLICGGKGEIWQRR